MNQIDSFVLWSIIQLHLSNRTLTPVFPNELGRLGESRALNLFLDIPQLVEHVLFTVQLISRL